MRRSEYVGIIDKKTAVTEIVTLKKGKLAKYFVRQSQINEHYTIEIKGEKVHFTKLKEGKSSEETEKLEDNFVVGPTLVGFIARKWDELAKGDQVKVRFGVPSRQKTIRFKLSRIKNADGRMVVQMKPSSFLVAAFLDPIELHVNEKTKQIDRMIGRVLPKRKTDSGFDYLEADVKFKHSK